jgi:YegS/Rv2252/BmrU family lipid kinase
MSTCVIFNPTARGDKARHFQQHVEELARNWTLKPTTGPGAARQLAAAAVSEGFKTIIAAGGDGTLNEVLNGIADAPDGFERVRLGILPLGTINVFARELRLPLNVLKLLRWIESPEAGEVLIDTGTASFYRNGLETRACFAQLAGAGIDARAVELVNWELKKRIGRFAYVAAGLRALGGHQPEIRVETDATSASGELVLIGNGKLYGGHFPVFHKSDLQDGILDALVFKKIHWTTLAGHLWPVIRKQELSEKRVTYLQGGTIRLTSERRVPFQIDGEAAGELPATITVLKQRLRVIAPPLPH